MVGSNTIAATGIPPEGSGRQRNLLVALALLALVAGMATLVYYSVPLYRLFCQVTGFGGTTQVAVAAPGAATLPPLTVRFDANVSQDLPWLFTAPAAVPLRPGEERQASFRAINQGSEPVLGTATFNVTPLAAGRYFNKIECFCFTEQLLMPGEQVDFPVSFFVDPAIAEDAGTSGLEAITLSYTFFNKGPEARDVYLRSQTAVAPSVEDAEQ